MTRALIIITKFACNQPWNTRSSLSCERPMPSFGGAMLGALLTAGACTALLLHVLLTSRLATHVIDRPNARSMHTTPTPRLGGLALIMGFGLSTLIFGVAVPTPLCLACALLVVVSFIDDVRGLAVFVRLPMHGVIGTLATLGVAPSWPVPGLILAAVALTWAINLYNFMDGLDGLAGGQAVFGFAAYALAAAFVGHLPIALACSALVGGALGFLIFNVHPARIFMGDAGSTSLGLLAGALGLWGVTHAVWPIWFPIVAFLPFILDASLTLLLRVLRGERFWHAHRQHAYQRLSLMGLGVPRTTRTYYIAMGLCAAAALLSLNNPAPGVIALVIASAGYALIQRRWHRTTLQSGAKAC
jgi:UDP-N-acetylmuramyl pentapeptide phosphotransferase/UDP-N-acetylglucosamine-1-phosphate transferase